MFSDKQKEALAAPLQTSNIKQRQQSGRSVSYITGWKAIEEANRIFGFDGWTRETLDVKCVSERAREIGTRKEPGHGVSYVAKVRITVEDIVREGIGAGHGIDRDLGQAHESAIKEAETDAMKRALMTFGYPFGLALYDKQQEHVVDDSRPNSILGPAAAQAAAEYLIGEIESYNEPEELDSFVRSDDFQRRVFNLPEAQRVKVREKYKAKAA